MHFLVCTQILGMLHKYVFIPKPVLMCVWDHRPVCTLLGPSLIWMQSFINVPLLIQKVQVVVKQPHGMMLPSPCLSAGIVCTACTATHSAIYGEQVNTPNGLGLTYYLQQIACFIPG